MTLGSLERPEFREMAFVIFYLEKYFEQLPEVKYPACSSCARILLQNVNPLLSVDG